MFATNFARNAFGALGAVAIAAACLTVAATPAGAETVKVSKVVSYSDLNLQSPRGRAALDARIKAAAQSICGNQGSDLTARLAEDRCVKAAVRNATVS